MWLNSCFWKRQRLRGWLAATSLDRNNGMSRARSRVTGSSILEFCDGGAAIGTYDLSHVHVGTSMRWSGAGYGLCYGQATARLVRFQVGLSAVGLCSAGFAFRTSPTSPSMNDRPNDATNERTNGRTTSFSHFGRLPLISFMRLLCAWCSGRAARAY